MAAIPAYSPLSAAVPGGEDLAEFRKRVASILEWLGDQPRPAIVVADEAWGRVLLSLTGHEDRSLKPCELIQISLIE